MSIRAFQDRFDEVAQSVVRLVFLVGVIYGTADYFGWGPYGFTLAVAFETLVYVLVRKIVLLREELESPLLTDEVRKVRQGKVWSTSVVTGIILAFLTFNQYNYLLSTWHPTHEVGPVWLPYMLRAGIMPVAIFVSSWLTPAPESMQATMERESMKSLREFLGVIRVQRKKAIAFAKKHGHDLTHAITAISAAAGDSTAGHMLAQVQGAFRQIMSGEPPSVPVAAPVSTAPVKRALMRGEAERLAREHFRKGMGPSELAKVSGLSYETAKYWITKLNKPKPVAKAGRPSDRKGKAVRS